MEPSLGRESCRLRGLGVDGGRLERDMDGLPVSTSCLGPEGHQDEGEREGGREKGEQED